MKVPTVRTAAVENEIGEQLENLKSIPVPNKGLGKEGKQLWYKLANELQGKGILFKISLELLENYCYCYETVLATTTDINSNGHVIL